MAAYAFNATDKAKTVTGSYGAATLNNGDYLDFSDNGYVTYKGNGKNFEGTNVGYIDLPASIVQALSGNYTISMWVKQDGGTSSTTAFWDMCQDDTGSDGNNRLFMQRTSNGTLEIRYRPKVNNVDGQPYTKYNDMSQTVDKWALITASFDLTGTKRLTTYVNGTAYTNGDEWTTAKAPSDIYNKNTTKQVFHLGRNQWARSSSEAANNPSLNGSIADVRIYNSALTAEEAAALMGVHRVSTIKYMAEGQEIADAVNVDTFTDTVTFDTPKTITYNEVVYELQTDNGFTEGTTQKPYEKTFTVNYAKKGLELNNPNEVVVLNAETIIDGNVPAVKYVELKTNSDEIPKINGVIDWESVRNELKYKDGEAKEVTADVKVDNVEDANVKAKINVTVLKCTDETNANTINSADGNSSNSTHKFANPVKGNVKFEFDLTYNANLKVHNFGGIGIFIGNTSMATGSGGGKPGYTWGGNAIGIQGSGDTVTSPTASNLADFKQINFRNGNAGGTAIDINRGETYRVTISTDTATKKYTTKIIDSHGNVLANSAAESSWRDTDFDILDAVMVGALTGDKELIGGDGVTKDNAIKVENFRVAWEDIDKYSITTFKYVTKSGGDAVKTVTNDIVEASTALPIPAYVMRADADGVSSASANYLWKADGNESYTAKPGVVEEEVLVTKRPEANVVVVGFEANKVVTANDGEKYKIVSGVNLIPNGNFAEGFAGWYDGTGNYLSDTAFWEVSENVLKHLKKAGYPEANASVLNNSWDVAGNKTYIITMKIKNICAESDKGDLNYKKIKFPDETTQTLSDIHTNEPCTETFAFTTGEDGGKVGIDFTWIGQNAELSDFGLFEATHLERPAAPEATLGWDGKNFTINYTGEAGQTVKVYHENEDDGAMVEVDGGSKKLTEDQTTVAVNPGNTNRIYTATVTDDVEGVAIESLQSAKASIYSLVVDALVEEEGEGTVDPNKLAAVNKVISSGGVYFDGETLAEGTALKEKTADIMTVTAENEVTINDTLIALNVGFVYNDGKLYVGTGVNAAGEADGTYSKLTIGGGTVTLGGKIENGKVMSNETVTLSLDSVNIEFVETLIEELESDSADAAQDFIPEL